MIVAWIIAVVLFLSAIILLRLPRKTEESDRDLTAELMMMCAASIVLPT